MNLLQNLDKLVVIKVATRGLSQPISDSINGNLKEKMRYNTCH